MTANQLKLVFNDPALVKWVEENTWLTNPQLIYLAARGLDVRCTACGSTSLRPPIDRLMDMVRCLSCGTDFSLRRARAAQLDELVCKHFTASRLDGGVGKKWCPKCEHYICADCGIIVPHDCFGFRCTTCRAVWMDEEDHK